MQPIIRMLCFVSVEGGFHNFKDGQEQIVHTRTQIYNKHTYKTLKASSALSRLGGAPPPPAAPAPIFPLSTYSWWKNVPTGRNLSSRSCQYLDARALAGKLNEVVPEAKFCQKKYRQIYCHLKRLAKHMGPVDRALVIRDFIQAVQLLICHRDMAAFQHLHVKLVNWLTRLFDVFPPINMFTSHHHSEFRTSDTL